MTEHVLFNLIYTLKYLDIGYVSLHLYSWPGPWNIKGGHDVAHRKTHMSMTGPTSEVQLRSAAVSFPLSITGSFSQPPTSTLFQARGRVSSSCSYFSCFESYLLDSPRTLLCRSQLATPGGGLVTCSQDALGQRVRHGHFCWWMNPDSLSGSLGRWEVRAGEHLSLIHI